ncbi:MAG: gluconate 2-dehydrogenase subunit 3 family protein, partial [Gemmatimonadales bacterium]
DWPAIASAGAHAATATAAPEAARFQSFSPAQAAEIDAMAARILPGDDGPGAREAGVVHFIDRALDTFARDQRALATGGLATLAAVVAQRHPGAAGFAALGPADQDDVLHAIEASDFFEFVRWGTVAGFLANPSYGGNRDGVGWQWIGFEDRFVWQPPFGYYDREDVGGR